MQAPALADVGAGFRKYFTAIPALSDDLKYKVYQIRHEVYCRELGYEPLNPEGVEKDEHDDHSIHCLLRSNADDEYIGCIRLVLARSESASWQLPFEKLCRTTLDRSICDPEALPRDRIAEVSRLAVIGRYRRRRGEGDRPVAITDADFGTPEQPRFPYIPVGLYLGMIHLARKQGIESLFLVTEVTLARQISRLGIRMQRIGGAVEHRGQRVPSRIEVGHVIQDLGPLLRSLYAVVSADIDAANPAMPVRFA